MGRVVRAVALLATVLAWICTPMATGIAAAAPPSPQLTADIQTNGAGSRPEQLVTADGKLFFVADDGEHGRELWVTDGAAAPTMVKDINPNGSAAIDEVVAWNGDVYFMAQNGVDGHELWKSDGTSDGTAMVKDVNPGEGSSSPALFIEFDGHLYFSAFESVAGRELWRTDGTEGGTELAHDLRPSGSSNPSQALVVDFASIGERLFVVANGSGLTTSNNRDLYVIDGEGGEAPTVEVGDVEPSELTALGQSLYFVARTTPSPTTGPRTLHRTSVAAVGPPADFTTASLGGDTPYGLEVMNGVLYMNNGNGNGTTGQELYRLNEATFELVLVLDINPGPSSSMPTELTASAPYLYFVANDGIHGSELWRSDGDPGNGQLVEDIHVGGNSIPNELFAGPFGTLVFSASDGVTGREPWVVLSNGNSFQLEDLYPGPGESTAGSFLVLDGYLYMSAASASDGWELFRMPVGVPPTEGADNISLFADILIGTDTSYPYEPAPVGDRIMFLAADATHGSEPWVFDPVTSTTTLIRDIWPGADSSGAYSPTSLGDVTVFTADDGVHGAEVWVTDGTTGGTSMVKDINPGGASDGWGYTELDGYLYFAARDEEHGVELWRTDTTGAGTTLVEDLRLGVEDSSPEDFVEMGGKLYFSADTDDGRALWSTDGSATGTDLVVVGVDKPLEVESLRAVGDELFFTAPDPGTGTRVLWTSDGTSAGTHVVELAPGPLAELPSAVTVSAGLLYFMAYDDVSGYDTLWVSDGSDAGTFPLQPADGTIDVGAGIAPLDGGGVVFESGTTVTGLELWVSDGTPAGTDPLADIFPGLEGSTIDDMTLMNGWVYFAATDITHGRELWRTDGATVERVSDLAAGSGDGVPTGIATFIEAVNDHIVFTGYALASGGEVWVAADVPPKPAAPTNPIAVASTASSATVSWTAPPDVPFAPVTGYVVTSSPGGLMCWTVGATSCGVSGLTTGQEYTFTVTATNRIGTSPPSVASNAVVPTSPPPPPPSTPSPMVPLVPARLLETRVGPEEKTVDRLFEGVGPVAAGQFFELPVLGRGGVPGDASAVMLNVTAVAPSGPGFVTVWPCGETRPLASSVNYVAGEVVPNAVLAKVGVGGKVCLFTLARADLVVDVTGHL